MGISLELYRARIGSYNSIKSKDVTLFDPVEMDFSPPPEPPPLVFRLSWKQGSLALLLVLINVLCHSQLLIMGCVERNPGPTPSPNPSPPRSPQPLTREEMQEDILAKLICDTNDNTVKDVLRLYKPSMTNPQLTKSLKTANVPALVTTMDFLGISNADKYKKDTIVDKMIVRIQSLFPDSCAMCKQDYVVHYSTTSLLSCAKCNQGIHSRCLAQKLGIAEVELETMTPDDILGKINPLSLHTMVYLCGYCYDHDIPTEQDGLKSQSAKHKQLSDLTGNASNIDSDDMYVLASSQVSKTLPRQLPVDIGENNPQHQAHEGSQDADTDTDTDTLLNDPPRKRRLTKTKSTPKHPEKKPKPTCSFYRRGQCRYGISGKGCSRAHPPLCRKLMTFGNKQPRGCTKGKECDRFHPQMCPSSLNTRECLNDTCSLYHVKGTRRLNSKPVDPPSRSAHKGRADTSNGQKSKPQEEHHSNPQEAFLEVLNTWTKQLMDSLDQRLLAARETTPPAPTYTHPNHPAALHQAAVLLPPSHLIQQGQGAQHQYIRY